MSTHHPQKTDSTPARERQHGSALIMAMFILTMIGLTAIALLHLGTTEMMMSMRALELKEAFYLAEAGEEAARAAIYAADTDQDFDDELSYYARTNGFELDLNNLRVVYDSNGNPTGVTGVGDDRPVAPLTQLGSGWYTSFVTNDPAEVGGVNTTTDDNDLIMITSIGAGRDRAVEVVQAIVERWELVPQLPPATITLLGDQPVFDGGTSNPHIFSGDDCPGGIPSLAVPVVGTIGSSAEVDAEAGINAPNGPDYDAGGWEDEATFVDLTNLSDPMLTANGFAGMDSMWTDCQAMHDFVEELRKIADVECCAPPVCASATPCALPATPVSNVIFVDGDYAINPPGGSGTLVVTGEVEYDGRAGWEGMIYAFGRGVMRHNGSGNGAVSGAIMVANIAGPDGIYGNGDDCTGGDANGFRSADYDMRGGGNGDTLYCSSDILTTFPKPPLRIRSFRQR